MTTPVSDDGTTYVAARFDPRTKARVGDEVQVVVDIDNAHFFDLETGQAIRD